MNVTYKPGITRTEEGLKVVNPLWLKRLNTI
jgi:hypothetical protein